MSSLPRHIDVTRLKAGTRILVQTETENIWALKVIDPKFALVEVYGTDPRFKDQPPVKGILLQSFLPGRDGQNLAHAFVKNWLFQIKFANIILVGGPLKSALVEGDNWSYEAIE
jgi:hypothetical protein